MQPSELTPSAMGGSPPVRLAMQGFANALEPHALRGVSFQVGPGEVHTLIGRTVRARARS